MYKKRNRAKKTFKKKSYSRTRGRTGVLAYAKKALKVASYVAKQINAEYKYTELANTGVVSSNAGGFYTLCQPAQGNLVNQRSGDSIKMKTLTLEGSVARNTNDEIFRLIIFIDKEMSVTTTGSFWENPSDPQCVFSDKNQDNKFKTKVLYDRKFTVSTYQPLHRFNIVLKVPYHVHFQAGTSTIENNGLRLFMVSQQGTTGALFTFHAHTTYLDN